jgi:hypothetical protein
MSRIQLSPFCSYEFESAQEERQASIFTEGNLQYIKNKLSLAMQERARLEYDPEKPITVFVQSEAALMGEIRAYELLIDNHETIMSQLENLDPGQRG